MTPSDVSERCPCCGVVGEKTERVGTFTCQIRACRVHFYQRADEHHDVAVGAPAAGDGRHVAPGTDGQPQADTGRCINCGDEIQGDGVYTQSGVKPDGHERLADGESVKISNLMEMDDGPYCSLDCSLDTGTDRSDGGDER